MQRRLTPIHRLSATALTLVFALAGLVSLHPALHVLWEHGGHGPEHVHARSEVAPRRHAPHAQVGAGLELHRHPTSAQDEALSGPTPWVQHRFRAEAFRHDRSGLGRTSEVLRWLARIVLPQPKPSRPASPDGSDPVTGPSHQHTGFAQLLTDGSLDAPAGAEPILLLPAAAGPEVAVDHGDLKVVRVYDPRAPRGPPFPNV